MKRSVPILAHLMKAMRHDGGRGQCSGTPSDPHPWVIHGGTICPVCAVAEGMDRCGDAFEEYVRNNAPLAQRDAAQRAEIERLTERGRGVAVSRDLHPAIAEVICTSQRNSRCDVPCAACMEGASRVLDMLTPRVTGGQDALARAYEAGYRDCERKRRRNPQRVASLLEREEGGLL
jgi:hypothetical protein